MMVPIVNQLNYLLDIECTFSGIFKDFVGATMIGSFLFHQGLVSC
jgi:hypothetical protein